MRRLIGILTLFTLLMALASPSWALPAESALAFLLEVKDKRITLKAHQVSAKAILVALAAKAGIKLTISGAAADHPVTLEVQGLPLSALSDLLEKMALKNYAVAYDQDRLAVFVLAKGEDAAQVVKGKTLISSGDFTVKAADRLKGRALATGPQATDQPASRYVQDEILLKFQLGTTPDEIAALLAKHHLTRQADNDLQKIGFLKVRISDGREALAVIKDLAGERLLKVQEPNFVASVLAISDPLYNDQWYAPAARFDEAWSMAKARATVTVAVIDSGLDAGHPDLLGKAVVGHDFVNNDDQPSDDHGHGTFVSGIIAAAGNAIGIKGLCDQARIMALKVIDHNGLGTYEDTALALIYAVDHGAKVINLSLGGYAYSAMLNEAVDYALAQGAIVVAAGGNDGRELPIYPAAYPEVIGVAALDASGLIWPGSNRGEHLDLAAPGAHILSTGLGGGYVQASGTSAAAPMVSALAALLVTERPELASPVLARLLLESATDLGASGFDTVYGQGAINAKAALDHKATMFHDLALRTVGVESMQVLKGRQAFMVAELENAGSYPAETATVVLSQGLGQNKREIARQEGVVTLAKTKVVFEWRPEEVSGAVQFEVAVLAAQDSNQANNAKTVSLFITDDGHGLITIQHQSEPTTQAHQYIAGEAWWSLPLGPMRTEIGGYIGNKTFYTEGTTVIGTYTGRYGGINPPIGWVPPTGQGQPDVPYSEFNKDVFDASLITTCNGNNGTAGNCVTPGDDIIEGTHEADVFSLYNSDGKLTDFFSNGNNDLNGAYMFRRHLWKRFDHSGGLGERGLEPEYHSPYQVAAFYWQRALDNYRAGNKGLSYYYLGRVAHFLADMSVPAHALADSHIPVVDPDTYEPYMGRHYADYSAPYKGFRSVPFSNFATVSNRSDPAFIGGTPWPSGSQTAWDGKSLLYRLFWYTAEIADNYDSNDVNGEVAPGTHRANGNLKNCSDLAPIGSTTDDCRLIAKRLMPLAFQTTAELYTLFWHLTNPLQITQALTLTPPGGYHQGQGLSATFAIKNMSAKAITLSKITVGGRLNGVNDCSNTGGVCPDFPTVANVVIPPGQTWVYGDAAHPKSRALAATGSYRFYIAYERDGVWYGDWNIPGVNPVAIRLDQIAKTITSACGAPASFTVLPSSDPDGSYTVSWGASPTAGVTYRLEEATNPAFTAGLRLVATLGGLSQVITGRTQGVTYYYRLQASKVGASSSFWRTGPWGCAVVSGLAATVALPGPPTVPFNDPDGGYAISWSASSTPGAAYALQEATNPAFSTGLRTLYAGAALSLAISGRAQNTTYYYRVKAIKPGLKDSAWQLGPGGCAVPGSALVGAPGLLTIPATDPDGVFAVSWGASATAGANYLVQEATNQTFTSGLRQVYYGPVLTAALSSRVLNSTYYYRVKAVRPGSRDSPWRAGANGCRIGPASSSVACPLNDTGITWYGDASQNFLLTPPVGFEGQDADYGRDPLAEDRVLIKQGGGAAGFDFTKLDSNGNELPASATTWSCVRDNHTGLTWEEKTNDGGLRDQDWAYSCYNSNPATNGGAAGYLDPAWDSCGGTLSHCNTEAYAQAVNSQGLCGARDWRLPKRQDLQSIVHWGRTNPSIDITYFPHTVSNWFWSSSPGASSVDGAWVVVFYGGGVVSVNRFSSGSVRLVRGGQ